MNRSYGIAALVFALTLASVLARGCSDEQPAEPLAEQPTARTTAIVLPATRLVPTKQPTVQTATPLPMVTEPVPTEQPAVESIPTATAVAERVGGVRIAIVYDNTAYDPSLKAEWGFAAWIEYGNHTLLFDTGGDGPTLLDNMAKLGLDPQQIELVVLSHEHGDHTGGLQALLDTGIRPTLYIPAAFPPSFKNKVRAQTELVEVTQPLEILPGVHSTGQLGSSIVEQGLVLETQEGMVVITGCAHPGIVEMVRRASEIGEGGIALVVGGFHLGQSGRGTVQRIIADFRQLGVQQVSPTHCTGVNAIAMFATEYGDDYIEGGVGREIVVGDVSRIKKTD